MHRIRLGVQMLTNTKQIQHYNPSLVGQPAVSITLEKGSNPYLLIDRLLFQTVNCYHFLFQLFPFQEEYRYTIQNCLKDASYKTIHIK